jgi:hypothetical protein
LTGKTNEHRPLLVRHADLGAARIVLSAELADANTAAHAAAANVRLASAPLEIAAADKLVAEIETLEAGLATAWLKFTALAQASSDGTLPSFSNRSQQVLRRRPQSPQINSPAAALWTRFRDEAVAWRKSLLVPIAA